MHVMLMTEPAAISRLSFRAGLTVAVMNSSTAKSLNVWMVVLISGMAYVLETNLVTIQNLLAPSFRAQKSSGFEVWLAAACVPLPRATSSLAMLSIVIPYLLLK